MRQNDRFPAEPPWRCPLGIAALSAETLFILLMPLTAWLGRVLAASSGPAVQVAPYAPQLSTASPDDRARDDLPSAQTAGGRYGGTHQTHVPAWPARSC